MKNYILKLTVILSLLLMLFIPFSTYAASSGICGDNLTWILDDEGVLTISGAGNFGDYGLYCRLGW